ncbi:NAD(P)/FAD-dependent oxidoreductase [Paenibacillus terrae]|uniref:FAD-binding domain-containing protein n=1 Tax=Paenibacillus terrae TaxID=159743 RepID=A0A0D7WTA4_9BACL|nr:FAD-dependent monooxygenase [Paenibacillus terrae]KJD42390.1 hypothetical protein QD47_28485 [Paenibacillus terrae]
MRSSTSNFDVIVVGSGPAGVAASIICAKKGLNVVILDQESFPRYRPGETLHPGIQPLLETLGVADQVLAAGFLRHHGNWVSWEEEKLRFLPFGSDSMEEWLGFQAWRADFDNILLKHAHSLGVKVLQPCRALKPMINHNRISGTLTTCGELKASYLVDSSGRQQWLAQGMNLSVKKYSPQLIVKFGYVQGEYQFRDDAPAIISNHEGWLWTARVRPNTYHWTRLSLTPDTKIKDQIPPEFRGLAPVGNIRGADVTWRAVQGPAGPGYYLAGDAANVLDPLSSHGVLKAMMTGMMSGHLISQVLLGKVTESIAIQYYSNWIKGWFQEDVNYLKKLYSHFPSFPTC